MSTSGDPNYLETKKGKSLVETIKQQTGENWLKEVSGPELNYFIGWFACTGVYPDNQMIGQAFRGFVKGLEYIKESKKS